MGYGQVSCSAAGNHGKKLKLVLIGDRVVEVLLADYLSINANQDQQYAAGIKQPIFELGKLPDQVIQALTNGAAPDFYAVLVIGKSLQN